MSKLIPDYVFDSIYDITPELLEKHGVRGVLIDLDGTMASHKAALPPEKLSPFVRTLHDAGLKVLVFSNNREARVGRFGNRMGALTFYVQTLDRHFFWINVSYQIERGFIERGKRRMEERARHG